MSDPKLPVSSDIKHSGILPSEERLRSEAFKETIKHSLRENRWGEVYVPHGALSSALNQELVKQILRETTLRHDQADELSRTLLPGAIKLFSILLMVGQLECILSFVEDDQMQSTALDQRLPLSLDKLLELLGDAGAAAGFYNQQWVFTAPVFNRSSLPRVLEKKTILPFIDSKNLGEGGFGDVYEVMIDPYHHSFAHPGHHLFVRKELKAAATTRLDYELELRNLSILRLLKHPCLIDLLACFTHRDRHNFIFPLADGGSLAQVLSGKRPSPFKSIKDTLTACCGLVSAIHAVHDYFADDVEAIGCHRDLKPSNILLDGTKLLLADFGLSRFKQLEDGSASQFKAGRGDYLAPECEDLDGVFKKHIIHRSSDMWSLGCILSEIMTLILTGTEGVQTFRSSRCFKIDNCTYYRFHRGSQIENPQVRTWLNTLGATTEPTNTFISIVRELLALNPEKRPTISVVDQHLRRLTIATLGEEIIALYNQFRERKTTIPAIVEAQRFWSWHTVVQNSVRPTASFLSSRSFEDFDMIIASLHSLRTNLTTILNELQTIQRRTFLPLRKLNDALYDALPHQCAQMAKERFEISLLESDDATHLRELSISLPQNSAAAYPGLGQLAALKLLRLLVETTPQTREDHHSLIDSAAIEKVDWLDYSYTGWLERASGQTTKQSVIVEIKNYDEHWSVVEIGEELFARLEAMVGLLNRAHSFPFLPCLGFYHDKSTYSLGLVYECPIAHQLGGTTVSTLHGILEKAKSEKGAKRPYLGDRFKLAYILASSVLKFHKVGWSQKAISAFNVIFFKPADVSWRFHMTEPYFLGYLSSRQDDESAFTEGPADDERLRRYLCPEYLDDRKRYEQHYDYYSLGLVLLELGHWSTLDELVHREGIEQRTPEELRTWYLKVAVPRLGQIMGTIYQKVVEECLRWHLRVSTGPETPSSSSNCLRFSQDVVEQLAVCKA